MATQDEVEVRELEELHHAVLALSSSCFEFKKLCATVIGSALTLSGTVWVDKVELRFLMAAIAGMTIFFWMADAQSFFYGKRMRERMDRLKASLSFRSKLPVPRIGLRISYRAALFAPSMHFYHGLLWVDGLASTVYLSALFWPETWPQIFG